MVKETIAKRYQRVDRSGTCSIARCMQRHDLAAAQPAMHRGLEARLPASRVTDPSYNAFHPKTVGRSRAIASYDRSRRLWYRLPEIGVVSEEDPRAASFKRLQPVERREHRIAVVHIARQAALAQGSAEITGVSREHDLAAVHPQPQGLMSRRVSVSW